MTDKNYTHITAVIDRSGSMDLTRTDAEGGVNSFLKSQFEAPGKTTASVYTFDDKTELAVDFAPVAPTVIIDPRGYTALRDAIGKATTETGEKLRAMPENERPGKVFLVVVTDGKENASREWSASTLKALLEKQQKEYSWEVIFMGADESSINDAQSWGINKGATIQYAATGAGTASVYATVNNAVLRSRSGGSANFTEDDRKSVIV